MPKTKIVDMNPMSEIDERMKGKTLVLKTMNTGKQRRYIDEMEKIKAKDGIYPNYYGTTLLVTYMLIEAPFPITLDGVESLEPEVFAFILTECKEMITDPLAKRSNSSSNEPTEMDGQEIKSS
jgi:hypothetical protein